MNLINQTPREELLVKLSDMQAKNLTEKQRQEIHTHQEKCADAFTKLCWTMTGLSEEQISKLNQKDFRELESLVADYAKPREKWGKVSLGAFLVLAPFFSWMWVAIDSGVQNELQRMPSWRYRYYMRRLKKSCGEDYSLHEYWHKSRVFHASNPASRGGR